MLRIFNSMLFIERENGVRRTRHRKLNYPRPIIARFLFREDRGMVLKANVRLRISSQYENVYITQDYAKAIQMERNVLIKAMFLARKKGMNARVVDRNLVVNNNVYNRSV